MVRNPEKVHEMNGDGLIDFVEQELTIESAKITDTQIVNFIANMTFDDVAKVMNCGESDNDT